MIVGDKIKCRQTIYDWENYYHKKNRRKWFTKPILIKNKEYKILSSEERYFGPMGVPINDSFDFNKYVETVYKVEMEVGSDYFSVRQLNEIFLTIKDIRKMKLRKLKI